MAMALLNDISLAGGTEHERAWRMGRRALSRRHTPNLKYICLKMAALPFSNKHTVILIRAEFAKLDT
jgi:hypothetical protein